MNPGLNNAVFVVSRHTQTGNEDGTPITTRTEVSVEGWFDEPAMASRTLATTRAGGSSMAIPNVSRSAMFAFQTSGALRHEDEGEILVGGLSQGRWTVERVDSVPIPGGVSHFEAILRRLEEGR